MKTASKSMPAQEKATSITYSRFRRIAIASLAGLGAGLLASLLAVFLMALLRLAAGIPSPVELFGDRVLKLLPAPRFVDMLVRFQPNPKTAPLGLALLGMIALGTVAALLYVALVRVPFPLASRCPSRRAWLTAAAFALGMTLLAVALFWTETAQNFLGLPLLWARLTTILALLADFGLYAAALCLGYHLLLPVQQSESPAIHKRRQLLARAGLAALGVGAAAGTAGLIRGLLSNYTSYDGQETFTDRGFIPPITPNDQHYTVTQNVVDPSPDISVWRLEVTGLVANAGTYTYEELQSLPSTSRAITLECIANGIGGHLMSTAIWQGVTLRALLAKHGGALPAARYCAFYSVDGYSISLPLQEVLDADPLLAWRMNGVELPRKHGYPLRVLIPGRFGEENPKWLTRVELTDSFVSGLYAAQGWYNGPLHTVTRIDRPFGHLPIGSSIEIAGIAFAGNRGIQRVEVSTDNGLTWQDANLKPALSQDAWVFWTLPWTPSQPGNYTLVARATDGTGAVQTSQSRGTVPNGATGYAKVGVQVG